LFSSCSFRKADFESENASPFASSFGSNSSLQRNRSGCIDVFGRRSACPTESQADPPVDQLITSLLDEDRQLRGIPFAEVIFDTTGKRVLPVNPKDQIDQRVIRQISAACDETIKRFTVQGKTEG
jgi:hypothetical protein